ncbi:MAG: hypothetical protein O9327_02090 [Polaromonas sp.]|nr:hypothetical protein [Polaromonas sp.]
MKTTWIASALLTAIATLANASPSSETEGVIKLQKAQVHTFVSSVKTTAEGVVESEKGSIWTGERVILINDKCFHTTNRLLEMHKVTYRDVSIDTPVMESKTVSIDCAAGRAGSLTWSGSLAP